MANKISDETIEYVGILAKLELSDEEKEQAKKDMTNMLNYIDTYFPHLASKNPLKDIYEFEKAKYENASKDSITDDFENSKK